MVANNKVISDIVVNFKGGGSFIKHPPVFSVDGESIFVSWKNSILEYNTRTGKLVHEYKGLDDPIIGFGYHIYNTYPCIIACSETGKIILWKAITHFKIFAKDLPLSKIKTFSVVPSNNDDLKALVSYQKKSHIQFAAVDLQRKTSMDFNVRLKSAEKYFIATSKTYFSIVYGNVVCFGKYNIFEKISRCFIHDSRIFTCLACHPTEEIVLTGDSSGRILVWQNIFAKEKTQSIFHWHTLPVQTVCFSTSGSYFYSGGNECVLVKWQLNNVNEKKFVPRLAADIAHVAIANNNLFVAVATSDNAIRIFDNTLNHTTLIQHLVLGKHYECGIIYDPKTRSLIMNGNQSHIQFYSPEDMSLLYNVDIIGQNKITNERECLMINTEITKLALSKSGLWLASVEERRDEEYHNEIRLKFWHFCETKQIFELNTSIEYPHYESVNSIMFQPSNKDDNLRCITVGNDRKFKVWQLEEISTVYKKGVAWKCAGVGFHRDLPCLALSFSVDGSLMATGFGSILTVWVPNSCELKCSLVHSIHRETVRQIQFGYSDQCHLLVSASANKLCAWNLLTLSMIWTVPVTISLLVADPLSTHMAVFTEDKRVFVFTPASHLPVYTTDLLKDSDKISTAAFVPSKNNKDTRLKWYERSHIYFISGSSKLYCLSNTEKMPEIPEYIESEYALSTFTPNAKISLIQQTTPSTHLYEKDMGHKAIKKYLLGPLHTMAPIRFTCQSLLKSLVIQKETGNVG